MKIQPGYFDYASIKSSDEGAILAGQDDPKAHYINVILPEKLRLVRLYTKDVSFSMDLRTIGDTFRSIVVF